MNQPAAQVSRAQLDAVDAMLRALAGVEAVFIPPSVPADAPLRVQVSICTLLGLLAQRQPDAVPVLRQIVAAVGADDAFWTEQARVAEAARAAER